MMKNPLGILLAVIVLLVTALGVWLSTRGSDIETPPAVFAPERTAESANASRAAHDLEGARPAESEPVADRETAAAQVPPSPGGGAKAPAKTPQRAIVEARFVDPDHSPIGRVRLFVDVKGQPTADSADDGRARVEFVLGREAIDANVRASAKDCVPYVARVHLERGKTLRLGDIVLELGGEIAGVVAGPDAKPFEGAKISVGEDAPPREPDMARVNGPELQSGWPTTKSGPGGTFRIEGAPARNVRLWVTADGMRFTSSDPIEVVPRRLQSGVVLKLEALARDELIEGIVVTPDRKPVPKSMVRYMWNTGNTTYSSNVTTGDDGRFKIRAPKKVPFELTAEDPEKRWQDAVQSGVLPGTPDLVLELREARWLDLAVMADGKPLLEFATKVRKPEEPAWFAGDTAKPHPDGHERLVVPPQRFVIDVVARSCSVKTLGPFEPETAPASLTALLEFLPGLRGRVTAHGEPVVGARVDLHKLVTRSERIVHNGYFSHLHPSAEESETTDGDGRYTLSARDDGTFALVCNANGYALAEISPIELVAAKGAEGLDFALVPGGAIEGKVLVAAGKEAAGLIVAINRGDARARTLRTGADGAYRFEGLTPGRWNVLRAQAEINPTRSSTSVWDGETKEIELPWNCVVEDGRTTRFDVDLREATPCLLAGHVEVNHAPATGWSVHISPELNLQMNEPPGGTVDAQGDVRVEIPEPGAYRLLLRPPATSTPQGEFATSLKLARGANPWKLAFDVGALEGSGGATAPTARYTIDAGSAGGLVFSAEIPLETGGACHFPIVPAGALVIKHMEKESTYNWREAGKLDVVVPAGGVKQVILP